METDWGWYACAGYKWVLLKEGEEAPVSAARDARPAANGDADLTSTSSLDRFYGSSVRGPGGVSADSERIRDSVEPQLALLSHALMQIGVVA